MASGHGHVLTATGRHRGRLGAVLAITLGIAVAEVCGALVSAPDRRPAGWAATGAANYNGLMRFGFKCTIS